jgi:6-methylsalicylate decarboxylase
MTETNRIDTHQHYIPPSHAKWLADQGIRPGDVDLPKWSKAAAIEMMDKHGIQTGILSVSDPGVNLGDNAIARTIAREVNEYAADVVQSNPSRFGFFATLTLPDVEGSIIELNYALDELHSDGVILLANSRGTYLGDKTFEPLMAELNRRKVVAFVHPGELLGPTIRGIPASAADFLLDTTRAVVNLVLSGAMDRYPDIRMLLAHAGGFVPYDAYRLLLPKLQRTNFLKRISIGLNQEHELDKEISVFRKFYYDTALSASPTVLPSLLSLVSADHITYGSDWPFAPTAAVNIFNNELERYQLGNQQRYGINRGTAETLFTRLA